MINKPLHQKETNEPVKYHCMNSCNACGGENELIKTYTCDYHIEEAVTKCKDCGHDDNWSYGFFESSQEMESKCKTYSFN